MISEKLDQLGIREKIGLGVAVFCVFALVVEKLVVQSMVAKYRAWDAEIEALAVSVALDRQILQSRDAVIREYEGLGDVLGKVTSRDEALTGMNGEVDDLARRTGVSLQSRENREPVKMGWGEEYSVVVSSFEADIQNLLTFLYELQKAPGMFRLNKLTVNPGKSKGAVKGAMSITKVMVPAGG